MGMSIFERMKSAISGDDESSSNLTQTSDQPLHNEKYTSEASDSQSLMGDVDELFGERISAVEIAPPLPVSEIKNNDNLKALAKQVGGFLGIGGESKPKSKHYDDENDDDDDDDDDEDEYEDEEETIGLFTEEYLRNIAQLKLTKLKLKHNLKLQGMKFLLSEALKGVGKKEQAEDVWGTEVVLGDVDDLLLEIIYMDLKHKANMGKLEPVSPEEFLSGLTLVSLEKLGGKGFDNFIELGKGAFTKGQDLIKSKKAPQEVVFNQ